MKALGFLKQVQKFWSSEHESLRWWHLLFTFKRAENSLANHSYGLARLIPFLLLVALVTLFAGLTIPILRVEKFFLFEDLISISGAISQLVQSGEYLIAVIILLFSVIFPTIKILVADYIWRARSVGHKSVKRAVKLIDLLGKWSMLDVFIVGMIVISAKSSGMASATSQPGMYYFGASVISSMIAVVLLKRAIDKITSSLVS
ncbi:paraquat-inducible protein A [Kiloniella sp. EL199]|uniref:paraquat-inducible protein A n=1 Tax=Kiloniella sp. EL199 TaxID=2107581 RepID=UPI000EA39502|nr:paraquat-inducible protein A [Kiloniella sp. EL199]